MGKSKDEDQGPSGHPLGSDLPPVGVRLPPPGRRSPSGSSSLPRGEGTICAGRVLPAQPAMACPQPRPRGEGTIPSPRSRVFIHVAFLLSSPAHCPSPRAIRAFPFPSLWVSCSCGKRRRPRTAAAMGSRYEVEVTVSSARDLKNVNWRNGDLKPYAVVWIDSGAKCSTRVDLDNSENPVWDEKLLVPLPPPSRLEDAVLYVDVVHANAAEGVKPLVGSARLPLRDVLADAGVGGKASRTLRLKRPSGRPQGRLDVRVAIKEPSRYYEPSPYPAPAYSNQSSRDPYGGYGAGGGYGSSGGYGAAQPYAAPPPSGYPSAYGSAPPQPAYGAAAPVAAYGAAGTAAPAPAANKKKGMGMGTGLAVGAAAGVLGGLALAGGASYLEDKFEERVAERVEDNLEREDSYGGGGYDDYGGADDDY